MWGEGHFSLRDNAVSLENILDFSSVERDPGRQKKLVRHGSVEIFDAAYNLTVPNKMARHASQTKLEEIHADHLFIPGWIFCVQLCMDNYLK